MIFNGSNVLVFDANGSPIACQKNVNVTFNDEVIDVTCKQSNGYSEFLPGKRNFSMTCEALTDWGQNLLLWSEEFNNAYWIKSNSTISANSVIAPNGTLTADTITDSIANDFHTAQSQVLSGVNGQNYTISCYVKNNNRRYVLLYEGFSDIGQYFDLQTGTILGTQGAGTLVSSSIENVGNDWYRCSFTYTQTGTSVSAQIYLSNNGSSFVYVGDGSSLYIWGMQLNSGVLQPYYQTTSTVNPNIDTLVSANLNRTKIELNIANPAFDDIYFNGEAYVESIEQNAGTEDVASYTVTFSGTGDLVSLVS